MTDVKDKIFLVTGATGKQGGATARNLLKAGAKVRALTRKPESLPALALKKLGAEVVKGNLNDADSLELAMNGAYGVFSVQNSWEMGTDEVKQSQNLADVAKKNNVQHLVFASVARCDDHPNLKHFESKHKSELYLKEIGIPFTVLRPVYFMDNLKPDAKMVGVSWENLRKCLGKKSTMQMIACEDIGWFAANAFLHPEEWIGKTVDIAGDNVTYYETLIAYQKVFGKKPSHYRLLTLILMMMVSDARRMFEWYREPRFNADIQALRKIHPGLKTIQTYFKGLTGGLIY